jgi:NAD(P)-dependent dehydrogenase (short-subunit alcohol dehydrogenase family)
MFAKFKDNFEKLDLLVNNAGAFNGGPLDQCSLEDWDHVINTNLRGPFMCTQQAFQMMKPQGVGRIINVGSISATRVRHSSAPYSTSKFGLAGLTQVTALEGRDFGITCCGLQPGNIETERRAASSSNADQEPMMSVHDIAEVALLMATLPPHVELLDAVVLPSQQLYVGRG